MRKTLLVIAVIMTLCFCLPFGSVFADEKCKHEKICCDICETAKSVDKVKDCKAIVIHGNAFIAVKLGGIATQSSAEKVVAEITDTVKTKHPKITQVYVTTSAKAFSAMDSFEKGVKLDEIVEMFGIDMRSLFPPRDINVKPDTVCYSSDKLAGKEYSSDENIKKTYIPLGLINGENTNDCSECEDKTAQDDETIKIIDHTGVSLPFGLQGNGMPNSLKKKGVK